MSILSRFFPKRNEPQEIKNNIPKEKAYIKATVTAHCHANHGTSGQKLCPKCTALLTVVMLKINRCPYGITKPICDRCETPCFPKAQTARFLKIMKGTQRRMLFRHPFMAIRHRLQSLGVDYALQERDKRERKKLEDREKAKKGKEKKKD